MDVLEEIEQALWIAKEHQEMVTAAECEGRTDHRRGA